MKRHLFELYKLVVERFFRLRTLGAVLLQGGLATLAILLGADMAGQIDLQWGEAKINFQGSTGSSLPGYIVYTVFIVALFMVVFGALLMWRDERREREKLLIVIEVRGLHTSPDSPARNAIKRSFRGQRHTVLVDFRPRAAGEMVQPELMLARIEGMRLNVESAAQGRDMSDVSVAVGGMAAIPGLFYVGMLMDDESRFELFDWDRDMACWKSLGDFDDGNRPHPLEMPVVDHGASEVVLAVSASYLVDDAAISVAFAGLPVARLTASKVETNGYWSEEVQRAFVASFRNAIQQVLSIGIKRIHLVLAAPASLTIRLGATYDERLHPALIVYQYERSQTPPYPWGIELPHHGSAKVSIQRLRPEAA